MKSKPTVVDLFAGAGGLTLGLERAGFESILRIETDEDSHDSYLENSERPCPGWLGQVEEYDLTAYGQRYQVDLVAGGPPCQPFSVTGEQGGAFDPRDGIPGFIQAIREIRPRAFVMENVPNLDSRRHRQYFDTVLSELADGYDLTYEILDAADFGVPQHRRRLFVVGFSVESGLRCGDFAWPEPAHGPGRLSYVTVRDVLGGLEAGPPNPGAVVYAKNPILRPQLGDSLIVNGRGRVLDLDAPSRTITAAGGNSVHLIDETGELTEYHQHLLRGGLPRQGEVSWAVRRLTLRQVQVLQGFPTSYRFAGPVSSQFRQVGNAVPPALGEAVGRSILKVLEGA